MSVINGCIVAGAGSYAQVIKFKQWFTEHSDALIAQQDNPTVNIPLPENLQGGDGYFEGLILYPDGDLIIYEGRTDVGIPQEQPFAIGSGGDFAIAVMKAGKSSKEAVDVAKSLDVFSGGDTLVFELPDEPKEITREYLSELSKDEILEELFGEESTDDKEGHVEEIKENVHDSVSCLSFKGKNIEVKIYPDGCIEVGPETDYFTSFVEEIDDLDIDDLKEYADVLGVKYAYNIGEDTLARRLDEKVKEIIDELNNE